MDELEFLVLGSGTSAGVPIIGCDCAVCRSTDARDERTRTSACVRYSGPGGEPRVVLLDASPDLRRQALRHDLRRCDAILFTHDHVDHTFGLDEVRRFNALMEGSIPVWAEAPTLATLRRVYRHIFEPGLSVNPSWVADLVPSELHPGRPVDLWGLRFTPLRLLHGELPILGFRIDAVDEAGRPRADPPPPLPLAWCTDVSAVPDATWPELRGLRTLFLDLLRDRPHRTHFSRAEAVEAAERIAAERTWFVHMTHELSHAELLASCPAGMAPAYDGLRLPTP